MKTIMYKLVCKDPTVTEFYTGSTEKTKNKRFDQHKWASKVKPYKVYKYINENGGTINWEMVILEIFDCDTKDEKFLRERYWQDLLKPTLNSDKAGNCIGKTTKERRKEHYEENKEKSKEHWLAVREQRLEKIKCDNCGTEISRHNMIRHKKTKKCQSYE